MIEEYKKFLIQCKCRKFTRVDCLVQFEASKDQILKRMKKNLSPGWKIIIHYKEIENSSTRPWILKSFTVKCPTCYPKYKKWLDQRKCKS